MNLHELDNYHKLSSYEQQLVDYVLDGYSNEQIAGAVSTYTKVVSHRTIETHLGNIYDTLGIRNRQELWVKVLKLCKKKE